MEQEIRKYIETLYDQNEILKLIEDKIYSGDYLDHKWDLYFDDEYKWYINYGKGEIEQELTDEIINKILNHFDFDESVYYRNIYGKIDDYIFEAFPILNKK